MTSCWGSICRAPRLAVVLPCTVKVRALEDEARSARRRRRQPRPDVPLEGASLDAQVNDRLGVAVAALRHASTLVPLGGLASERPVAIAEADPQTPAQRPAQDAVRSGDDGRAVVRASRLSFEDRGARAIQGWARYAPGPSKQGDAVGLHRALHARGGCGRSAARESRGPVGQRCVNASLRRAQHALARLAVRQCAAPCSRERRSRQGRLGRSGRRPDG